MKEKAKVGRHNYMSKTKIFKYMQKNYSFINTICLIPSIIWVMLGSKFDSALFAYFKYAINKPYTKRLEAYLLTLVGY